jgi:DNA-binding IclR family transcriptional regulator
MPKLPATPLTDLPDADAGKSARASNPSQVMSLSKMLAILECFSRNDRALSVMQIAERTGLPRPTAHRLVSSMRAIGFIDQDRDRERYRLGLKIFELGNVVLANMEVQREAQENIAALVRGTGLGVHLGIFDGFEIVMVDQQTAQAGQQNHVITLESASVHCSATGKASLAFQPQRIIDRVLAQGLPAYTRHTLTCAEDLLAQLEQVRIRGYAVDHGESEEWRHCVAAPIRNAAGRVFAAISLTGAKEIIDATAESDFAELVRRNADDISRKLGYLPE